MSYCSTNIEYNGVVLTGVLTESISYDPVYDQTGCDLIGMRTQVVVTAYAHDRTHVPTVHGVNAPWATGASQWPPALTALFRRLSMPRRRFRMLVNNWVMFDILPTAVEGRIVVKEGDSEGGVLVLVPGQEPIFVPWEPDENSTVACNNTPTGQGLNQDIAHGPKCSYQVIGIQGGHTAKCRFTFEFTTPLCENPSLIRDFLHLRYWIVDDIDCTAWLTTRTYQGTFRVKGMQVDAHALARQITLPPIQPGFRRTRINWSESPDHLTLNFSIVDVEQKSMAPSPATHWEGSYSVSVPQGDITAESELRFRLWGDVTLDKTMLFKLGQHILNVKLNYLEMLKFGGSFLVLAQIWEEKLEANEISIYVKIRHMGNKENGKIVARFLHNMQPIGDKFNLGKDLDPSVTDWDPNPDRSPYDPLRVTTPPGGLPTAGLGGIFICALQTPCCPQTLSQNIQTDKEVPESDLPTLEQDERPPAIIQDEYDTQPVRYSDSHMESAYLWYRMTSHYHKDTGWRAFPIGKQCTATATNTVSFSRIHCPVAIREIRVEACRMNKSPELPDFRDSWTDSETGIIYVLKDVVFEPSPPQLSADARHEIREMYARYFYYMSRPPLATEDWLAGRLPYVEAGTEPLLATPDGKPGTLVPTEAFQDPATIFGREAPGMST
jgi:hypothetical protein